jgi:hypothetical protein
MGTRPAAATRFAKAGATTLFRAAPRSGLRRGQGRLNAPTCFDERSKARVPGHPDVAVRDVAAGSAASANRAEAGVTTAGSQQTRQPTLAWSRVRA